MSDPGRDRSGVVHASGGKYTTYRVKRPPTWRWRPLHLRWCRCEFPAALPAELPSEDVSGIVSGSLGHGEFTLGSDIDLSLLLPAIR